MFTMRSLLSASILVYVWIISEAVITEVEEICETDSFKPRCEQDEMIIIRLGRYGRMREGSCITRVGSMGCSVNARPYLDELCSGRRQCDLVVATLIPTEKQPCRKDFRSYLEVAYDCVEVATLGGRHCSSEGPLMLRSSSGYLSSVIAEETGCGSQTNPWVIRVKAGQKVKVTLYNFGSLSRTADASKCAVFAVIKEPDVGKSEALCAKPSREHIEYISLSSSLEIRMMRLGNRNEAVNSESSNYMLRYEAVGCPDIAAPPSGWMVRLSDTEILYGCNSSVSKKWRLHCEGTEWKETMNNCSDVAAQQTRSESGSFWEFFHLPTEISIVLIACIAVVVGCFILAVGVVYLKCLRGKRNFSENTDPARNSAATFPSVPCGSAERKCGTDPAVDAYQSVGSSENDYYRTWQLQRHAQPMNVVIPPPPTAAADDVARASLNASRGYVEHIYESPIFERRPIPYGECSGSDLSARADYFELDIRPSPHCKEHRHSDGAIQRSTDR